MLLCGEHIIDLVAVIVFYLSARKRRYMSAIFAFLQGIIMDIYSSSIYGISPFLYLFVCILADIFSEAFDLKELLISVILFSVTLIAKTLLFFILIYLFLHRIFINYSFFLSHVILTTAAFPFIAVFLDRIG